MAAMTYRLRRSMWTVAAAAVILLAPSAAHADAAPPARLTSRYETATGNTLGRDCGYSVPVPGQAGQALWLFCDTTVTNPAGEVIGFIGGTTGATGPYTAGQVPDGLSELPTPPAPIGTLPNDRGPAPFLPAPAGLTLPDGVTPCGSAGSQSYAASWLSGLAAVPASSQVFATYVNVCVWNSTWTAQSYGATLYDPATNRLSSPATIFTRPSPGTELPWERHLGSPVFGSDGYLYLFAFHCDEAAFGACGSGRTLLARVRWSGTGWQNPANYRYRTASGWTSDPSAAVSVLPGAKSFGVDVRSYPGRGLVLVEQTSIGGHYRLWRASSPTGPWTVGAEQVVPGCLGVWCYAFIGHPELSTADGLMLSFYDPNDKHVRVARIPWT
jgi:hypothetical protein